MIRRLSVAIPIVVLSLLLAVPVLAAYYIDIDVTESNSTDYDMLAMNVSMDIDYLAANGFIDEDGLDVRVKNSQGNELPFMLAEDKLMFASAIQGDKTTGFQMTTGNSELDSFPVIVGDGGYVTISDHANLELGDDFEIEFEGWVKDSTLVEKADSFSIYGSGGDLYAKLIRPDDLIQEAGSDTVSLKPTSYPRVAQRVNDVAIGYIDQISFYLVDIGLPTGTAYARARRVSDDEIVGTFGSIDVSTISGGWYDFTTPVYNPTEQSLRFTIEYGDGDGGNYIIAYYGTLNDLPTAYHSRWDGSWSDLSDKETTSKVLFSADTILTAPDESDEYHKIKVASDGSDIKLYIDDIERDSATADGAVSNSNDWALSMLYFDYYKHTTSNTLRITYEPDDIISGTTLPNEENPGTYDGTITWGANPAGISIDISSLELEETYYYTGRDTTSNDIFEPEPAELAPGQNSDKLDHNPLNPGVEGFAAASDGAFTESLVWYGIAWLSVIVLGIALIILVREHLVFAASVSFGLCIFWYVSGVFDYWVLLIFGIFFAASLVHERMVTW